MNFVFLLVGLIVGAVAAWLIKGYQVGGLTRNQARELEDAKSRLEERNGALQEHLEKSEKEMALLREERDRLRSDKATLEADFRNLKERLSEQKKEMEELQERFKTEFENLANKILEDKSKKFTEQNKEKLEQLLTPLRDKIDDFRKKVEESHKEDLQGRSALEQHLKNLQELNHQMSEEAKNLTKALKGESKTQGSWGEMILQRILEKSGLVEGREYETQVSSQSEDGHRIQPDVIVTLPDDKHLIIDSKVSLKAYEEYVSSEDELLQQRALKKHIESIRSHVRGLSAKNYQQLFGGKSPDFVLMFLPIESAFGIALQYDSNLYYEAFERNIVIVSPSTLLATLATIDSVWKQEYQNRNAQEIARQGGNLYDKFVGFVEDLQKIGDRIGQTQKSYDDAMNKLQTGRGSLISRAEKIRKLKVNVSKQLPGELLDDGEEDE